MQKKTNSTKNVFSGIVKDLWIVVLDIIAVNVSYYLALLIRFYVNFEFRPTVTYYIPAFLQFAPFYTVLCIIVFALFRLYNGMWKYAGINDMNRIISASLVTCLIQIVGTLLFIRRMPVTYYVIGAIIQFVLISLIRFSYRIVTVEKKRLGSRNASSVNVMVVGAGEIGRRVIRHLEEDTNNAFRPVCVIDSRNGTEGKTLDGVPVIGGTEQIGEALQKYGVKSVFIADSSLSAQKRNEIKQLCQDGSLDLQDYTGYLSNLSGRISLSSLLEAARGPVEVIFGEEKKEYPDGEAAILNLTGSYTVDTVSVKDGKLSIELRDTGKETQASYEDWVRKHQEETGEEISYF